MTIKFETAELPEEDYARFERSMHGEFYYLRLVNMAKDFEVEAIHLKDKGDIGLFDGKVSTLILERLRNVNIAFCEIDTLDLSRGHLNDVTFFNCKIRKIIPPGGVNSLFIKIIQCEIEEEISDLFYYNDMSGTKINGVLVNDVFDIEAVDWLEEHCTKVPEGYIVYKRFNCFYPSPSYWTIEPGSILEERVDADNKNECSYGINVSHFNYQMIGLPNRLQVNDLWRCLISLDDLDKVCIPSSNSGKIRASRITLLEKIGMYNDFSK